MNFIIAFHRYLSSSKKSLNGDSNPDLCDGGAVLNRLSYQERNMTMLYDMHYHLKIKDLDFIGDHLKSLDGKKHSQLEPVFTSTKLRWNT